MRRWDHADVPADLLAGHSDLPHTHITPKTKARSKR